MAGTAEEYRDLQVAAARGGVQPRWAHSGKGLFFVSDNGYLMAVRYPTNPTSTVVGADTRFPLNRYMHGIVFMKRQDRVPDDQLCVMVGAARGPTRFVEVDGLQSPLPTKR